MKSYSSLSFLAVALVTLSGVVATPLDPVEVPSLKLVTRNELVEREDCYGPELPEATPVDGVLGGTTESGSALEKRDNYNGVSNKRHDLSFEL